MFRAERWLGEEVVLGRPAYHSQRAIEVVGTCADGDGCLRWHCRACGRYWLGDEPHACSELLVQLRHTVCAWMKEALEGDEEDLPTCARNVLEQVKDAGLGEAFLDAF